MRDEEVFNEAVRIEDWTRLAGDPAGARARSSSLRRTRNAGIIGATSAVVAIAAVVAGSLGVGGSARGRVSAGPDGGSAKPSSSKSPAAVLPQKPVKGTMGALFEQWKSCPDSELRVVNTLPQDPSNLQQRWRDACHRNVVTLTALLPGYDVSPAVAAISTPQVDTKNPEELKKLLTPDKFDDPSFVIPTGYTPHMGPNLYRIAGKDGGVGVKVAIWSFGHDDQTKPHTGEQVTLPNGLQAQVTLGTELAHAGENGYEIYIQDHGKTFYMFLMSHAKPDFDFKALVTSRPFANLAAQSLAEPEG